MCDIRDERSLTVCDVAVARYRTVLGQRLGESVTFTHTDYKPTLIECHDESRLTEFRAIVRELMEES